VANKIDIWKMRLGRKDKEVFQKRTAQDALNLRREKVLNRSVREVGAGQERILLTTADRETHTHILGTTGEGKSKLIELLIRGDIKDGHGVCFLDPTDRAETAYSILRYCQSIGFEKVCLIDPHLIHSHNRVPCIQPFNYKKTYKAATVANVLDTVRILFQTKDAAETPRIQRYLSAILNALWNAEMTLHEAIYFTEYKHSATRRKEILGHSDPLDRHRLALEEVFETYYRFNTEFASTVRRLEPFFDSTLDLMFGADSGIDFIKMITEGWVILVNLYSGLGFEPIHTRLLGTTIINEVIFALDRLRNRGWKGTHYLYLDEAGRFANRNLADLLAYKRKSGLRVTVAHQYFNQFEDKTVLDAVKNLTKTKVMFDTPNPADRLEMVKLLGYGGDVSRAQAEYANADLSKQYAIIKKPKQSPVKVRIGDVPDVKLTRKAQDEFIFKLLNHEWYRTPDDIRKQFEQRFDPAPPKGGRPSNSPPTGKVKKPKSIFD
jgi:hypothetical protein